MNIDFTKYRLSIILRRTDCVMRNNNEDKYGRTGRRADRGRKREKFYLGKWYPSGRSFVEGRFRRDGRKLTVARAMKYDKNNGCIPGPRIWIEDRPASFGYFTVAHLKEIIAEIELFPSKKEWHFYWGLEKHSVFIVTLAPLETEDENEKD